MSDNSTGRPRWSVSQAAKRAGVARSTIQRSIAQGKMPGAYLGDDGAWSIGVDDLLAAGFRLDAPSPPDPADDGLTRAHAQAVTNGGAEHAEILEARRRLAELETELADARRRADVAEAIAHERAARIGDLQRTIAALEAGRSSTAAAAPEPPPPAAPHPPAAPAAPVRGIARRIADRWRL